MAESRFDPTQHLTLYGKGPNAKDYLPVAARLLWLEQAVPRYTIDTEFVELDDVHALARATVTITDENGIVVRRATDFKHSTNQGQRGFGDFCEKAITGAIGRALAQLGFGTQFAAEIDDDDEPAAVAPRQGSRPGAGGNVGTVGPGDDWSLFWPWAKAQGLPDKFAVEQLIRRPMDGLSPADAWRLIVQAKPPAGAAGASQGKASAAPAAEVPPAPAPRRNLPATTAEANQAAMPTVVDEAEAALIAFTERAEAGTDLAALLDEAGTNALYLTRLAQFAPSLTALKQIIDTAKHRGRYTLPVINAERKRQDELAQRAAAFTG